MQYEAIQTLFDSLCQCLGTTTNLPRDSGDDVVTSYSIPKEKDMALLDGSGNTSGSRSPATRRTHRLALQDKQWDALFESTDTSKAVQQTPKTTHTHTHGGSSDESSPENSPAERSPQADMETAKALAQAKQAANPSRYNLKGTKDATAHKKKAHKRKRPPPSRDDIFRSRKFGAANTATRGRTSCIGDEACLNPISKFLSNHQGFANALCFATPVKDEDEEDGDEDDLKEDDKHNDNNSMASEANTLNTCEDSMLLLDRKLAQMSQNQPPMPLFHDFKVNQNDGEGLRRIVDTESHSSTNLMKLWKESQQQQRLVEQQQPQHHHQPGQPMQVDDPMDLDHHISSTSSSSSNSSGDSNHGGFHGHQLGRGAATAGGRYPPAQPAIPEEDVPPPMKKSSTGSSSDSGRSARHRGEI